MRTLPGVSWKEMEWKVTLTCYGKKNMKILNKFERNILVFTKM